MQIGDEYLAMAQPPSNPAGDRELAQSGQAEMAFIYEGVGNITVNRFQAPVTVIVDRQRWVTLQVGDRRIVRGNSWDVADESDVLGRDRGA